MLFQIRLLNQESVDTIEEFKAMDRSQQTSIWNKTNNFLPKSIVQKPKRLPQEILWRVIRRLLIKLQLMVHHQGKAVESLWLAWHNLHTTLLFQSTTNKSISWINRRLRLAWATQVWMDRGTKFRSYHWTALADRHPSSPRCFLCLSLWWIIRQACRGAEISMSNCYHHNQQPMSRPVWIKSHLQNQ